MPHTPLARAAFCILPLLLVGAAAANEPVMGQRVSGVAKPLGEIPGEDFSTLTFEMERCGSLFRTRWHDSRGRLLAADELEAGGGTFMRYRYTRPTVDEHASVTPAGESLRIEHVEEGVVRTESLPAPISPETVVGPMIALTAERDLERLRAGASIQVRYAVPDRLAVYPLTLRGRVPSSEAGTFEVEVTADQWIVRQFARPVSLFFDDAGKFVRMRGRALPASGTPGDRHPMEVDARVLAAETGPCSPEPSALKIFAESAPAR